MNVKKRLEGSWVDAPDYLCRYSTQTDTITKLPANIIANGTKASVGLRGNLEQQTYSGKNLFDISTIVAGRPDGTGDIVRGDATSFSIDGNTLTFSTTGGWAGVTSDYIEIDSQNASISYNLITTGIGEGVTVNAFKYWYDENKAYLGNTSDVISSAKYIRISFQANVATSDAIIQNIQLELGSTATSYEPYVGGAPSPNPDYPQEVKGCGDKTTNLLNFEDLLNAPEGIMPDTELTFPHVLVLYLKPNTTYICSSDGTGSNKGTPSDLYRSLYFSSGEAMYSVNVDNSVTYTTDSTGRVLIGFFDERTNSQQYLNKTAYIMLNEGETALPYEPYGYKIPFTTAAEDGSESITTTIYSDKPLYKIGDSVDVRDMMEDVRAVKELVLTGEENFQFLVSNDSIINSNGIITGYVQLPHLGVKGYCSHFIRDDTTYTEVAKESFGLANFSRVYLRLHKDRATSREAFIAWFKSQYEAGTPVKVYCVLSTPETSPVAAAEIPTLSGTTVIDVTTSVKPSEISLDYTGWHPMVVHRRMNGVWT